MELILSHSDVRLPDNAHAMLMVEIDGDSE